MGIQVLDGPWLDVVELDELEAFDPEPAVTRAEDRLIVCGWKPRAALPDTSWYAMVARGFAAMGAAAQPFEGGWEGERLVVRSEQTAPVARRAAPEASRRRPNRRRPGHDRRHCHPLHG